MEKNEKLNFYSYLNSLESNFRNKKIFNELILNLKYKYPSKIQEKILEDVLSKNKDNNTLNNNENNILCSAIKAEAGTGKTLGYLIKLFQSIDFSQENELQGIIVTPTRELALQTEEYLNKIENLKYKILIGGKANIPGKIKKEKLDINNLPMIIVGTLGKLSEILISKKKKMNKKKNKNILNNLKILVIDEADKMIDQNKPPINALEKFLNYIFQFLFNNNYKKNDVPTNQKNNSINLNENIVLDNCDSDNIHKQLILCSASFNNKTEKFYTSLISKYIKNTENIFKYFTTTNINEIKNEEIENKNIINDNIKEYNINFYDKKHESFYEQKYKTLIIILSSLQTKYNQCLIFYNKKNKGEELSQDLRNYGFSICFIHGELNQDERQLIYTKIKNLDYKIILSTDLLSRGIDLTSVNLVINFDQAFDDIEHNHRVGRTGRFFEKGVVISFYENKNNVEIKKSDNSYNENEIEKVIKIIENELIISERLTKEEIDKINERQNKNNNILKEALTEINGVNVLLQKKRKLQFEKESLIKSDDLNQEKSDEDNEEQNEDDDDEINKNTKKEIQISLDNELTEEKKDKKKFCLYCDLFKIFDIE